MKQMDSSNLRLDERQKSAALESITRTREGIVWKLEQESKYLDEYKQQYIKQQNKVDLLLDELNVLNELIAAFGINLPAPDIPASQEDKQELDAPPESKSKNAINDEFAPSHKRIQYPSSPKEKLRELVLMTEFFSTDDELLEALQNAFRIPEIPKKTVINYLQELNKEKIIGRVKSKKLNAFVNGSPDWFDSDGTPLPERLEYKNLRV